MSERLTNERIEDVARWRGAKTTAFETVDMATEIIVLRAQVTTLHVEREAMRAARLEECEALRAQVAALREALNGALDTIVRMRSLHELFRKNPRRASGAE